MRCISGQHAALLSVRGGVTRAATAADGPAANSDVAAGLPAELAADPAAEPTPAKQAAEPTPADLSDSHARQLRHASNTSHRKRGDGRVVRLLRRVPRGGPLVLPLQDGHHPAEVPRRQLGQYHVQHGPLLRRCDVPTAPTPATGSAPVAPVAPVASAAEPAAAEPAAAARPAAEPVVATELAAKPAAEPTPTIAAAVPAGAAVSSAVASALRELRLRCRSIESRLAALCCRKRCFLRRLLFNLNHLRRLLYRDAAARLPPTNDAPIAVATAELAAEPATAHASVAKPTVEPATAEPAATAGRRFGVRQ